MNHLNEKTISAQSIYKGKIIDLVLEEVELPNGKTSKREIVKHPGAVAVIAVTKEKKIVMVRQFRKALNKTIIEIPAGKLEKGEDPLQCARRELEEETGYTCDKMEQIGSFYTSPGFADELIYLFYTDTLRSQGEQNPDEDEFVDVLEMSLDEAKESISNLTIHDAKTAYAVALMELKNGTN